MTAPITNHNPALIGNSKMQRPDTPAQGGGQGPAAQEGNVSGGQEDGVTLSRAAQVLSQQPSERSQGVIQSADQAAQLAQGLRAQVDGNSDQALAAQANNISVDLMDLLKDG